MSQKKSDRLDKKIKSLTDEIAQLQRKRSEILDERIIDELPMKVIDDDGKEVKIDRAQVAECIRRFFKVVSLSMRAFAKNCSEDDGCDGWIGVYYLGLYIDKECGTYIYEPTLCRIWELVHECRECSACNRRWLTAQCNIPTEGDEKTKSFWDYIESKSDRWSKQAK